MAPIAAQHDWVRPWLRSCGLVVPDGRVLPSGFRTEVEDGTRDDVDEKGPLEDVVAGLPAIDVPMEEWDDIIQDEAIQHYAKNLR